jgi:hypothetical protein
MRPLNQYFIFGYFPDVSTADELLFPCPDGGNCIKVYTVLQGAITTPNCVITPKANGVAMTNGGITIAFSGSGAGDIDESDPSGNNFVEAGGYFSIETGGESGGTAGCGVVLVIAR